MSRVHIAITTHDLNRALPFYETLWGIAPVKVREDYAKFDVAEPSVNFTINLVGKEGSVGHRDAQHFGIQVDHADAVFAARARLEAAGLATKTEEGVTCCYAVQDKVWAIDPDGHRWEIFVTHADAEVHSIGTPEPAAEPCCAPSCCK